MKFNKWTVALAALGVVSLSSAAKAKEQVSPVTSALAATTISGYIDTSAEWNPNGNAGNYWVPGTGSIRQARPTGSIWT